MKAITKGPEPESLAAHRNEPYSSYDNYAAEAKDDLRRVLVSEQRGLCCYCMRRIRPERTSMKIEHWRCRAQYPEEQLRYQNLLGACLGGQGERPRKQHCDTSKRNQDLAWNPADPTYDIAARIGYDSDGSIRSDDTTFDGQLKGVLNLNCAELKSHRKGILDAILAWSEHEAARTGRPVPRERLLQRRDDHVRGAGELPPYCQVTVWWLEWIARETTV